MFHGAYEEMVRFASEGRLDPELRQAKAQYVERTGELFESDPSFERRLGSFLEWYVLDRPVSFAPQSTPAQLYIEARRAAGATDLDGLAHLTHTLLSLFEFKRARGETMYVVDLLSGAKHEVFERRKPAGLEANDVLEARLVPFDARYVFSEAFGFAPREARRAIARLTKTFRKGGAPEAGRIDLVHRVAYFTNRCARYKHVDPKKIFADL